MAMWHRSWRADIVLRATGLLLCWVGYNAIARLVAMHVTPQKAGVLAGAIATAGFMAASAGSALVLLGHHLFDPVKLSARWRARPDLSSPVWSAANIETSMPEPVMLVAGGATGEDGTVLLRSAMLQPAPRFAHVEQRGRTRCTNATSAGSLRRVNDRLCPVGDRVLNGVVAHG